MNFRVQMWLTGAWAAFRQLILMLLLLIILTLLRMLSFRLTWSNAQVRFLQPVVILDVGVDFTNRKLAEPNTPNSFRSSDALFSHVYVGIPIRRNWGLAFGIRPITRISYDIFRTERLGNPTRPGGSIDSAITQFTGTGGSFLPTIGTGFGSRNFSVGFNVGYLFGKKELTTRRAFINDTVEYAASNHTSNTTFGNVFFDAGAQYTVDMLKILYCALAYQVTGSKPLKAHRTSFAKRMYVMQPARNSR
jgi:hypothetical protein